VIDQGWLITVGIICYTLGMLTIEVWKLIFPPSNQPDEEDITEKSLTTITELQGRLNSIRGKVHDVQKRYLTCQDEKTELQSKLDEKEDEIKVLLAQLKEKK
jgi:peptidoglycan hydrolase CwlO-like protein